MFCGFWSEILVLSPSQWLFWKSRAGIIYIWKFWDFANSCFAGHLGKQNVCFWANFAVSTFWSKFPVRIFRRVQRYVIELAQMFQEASQREIIIWQHFAPSTQSIGLREFARNFPNCSFGGFWNFFWFSTLFAKFVIVVAIDYFWECMFYSEIPFPLVEKRLNRQVTCCMQTIRQNSEIVNSSQKGSKPMEMQIPTVELALLDVDLERDHVIAISSHFS